MYIYIYILSQPWTAFENCNNISLPPVDAVTHQMLAIATANCAMHGMVHCNGDRKSSYCILGARLTRMSVSFTYQNHS